jgi:hypothetical protein
MFETMIIGMLTAAVLLLPAAIVICAMDFVDIWKQRQQEKARCELYAKQEDTDIRLRNTQEDERIRRLWEEEAEELEALGEDI